MTRNSHLRLSFKSWRKYSCYIEPVFSDAFSSAIMLIKKVGFHFGSQQEFIFNETFQLNNWLNFRPAIYNCLKIFKNKNILSALKSSCVDLSENFVFSYMNYNNRVICIWNFSICIDNFSKFPEWSVSMSILLVFSQQNWKCWNCQAYLISHMQLSSIYCY